MILYVLSILYSLHRMKIDKGNGELDGTPTSCSANNTNCPELEFIYRHISSHERWSEKGKVHRHLAKNYGMFYFFSFIFFYLIFNSFI